MKPLVFMREALADPALLGNALPGPSWLGWRALLIASQGEALTAEELAAFTLLTGRTEAPSEPISELWAIVGRRGGKSAALAVLLAYLGGLCDWRDDLKPGETGTGLVVAADLRQARAVLSYAEGALMGGGAPLQGVVVSRTADAIQLKNNIVLEARSANFRRLRGLTAIAVIADEIAFWRTEDNAANPDTEILAAARPCLATTGGPLICASSPYAKRGELYGAYRHHYGADGDSRILVAKAPSRVLNPALPQSVVDRAMERDPASARAEYGAEFRDDISGFVSRELIDACTDVGVTVRAPLKGIHYFAFADPAGGSGQDSFACAVAHVEKGQLVLDALMEARPPFNPETVSGEFAAVLKRYRVSTVTGDRYAGAYPSTAFARHGIRYVAASKAKSELYRDFLPRLSSGEARLLDDKRLANQLCSLERRVARGGKDSIDHPPNQNDDLANVAAGALLTATKRQPRPAGVQTLRGLF
jgi:hypothetical protein